MDRKKPILVGTNEKGELVWGFIPMARWEMEMFRVVVDWYGDLFTRWYELVKYEATQEEFNPDEPIFNSGKTATQDRMAELRRMYPRKRKGV